MNTIRDVLDHKGTRVCTIPRASTIDQAVALMCHWRVGALLVYTNTPPSEGEPLGILSERDVMTRVLLEKRDPAKTRVEEAMTREVVCIGSNLRIEGAMGIMTEKRCRHLPVIDAGRVIGVVSIGDLVRAIGIEQSCEIRTLTEYIGGASSSL